MYIYNRKHSRTGSWMTSIDPIHNPDERALQNSARNERTYKATRTYLDEPHGIAVAAQERLLEA
jgi:hypothetical protein